MSSSENDASLSLDRFLVAQAESYDAAMAEIVRGRKENHWMWFIFPQLRGLGQSRMSWFYGIADRDEAERYLAQPVLGPRLLRCAEAVLVHHDLTASEIFAEVDAAKLRSSATLFAAVDREYGTFDLVLERFFGNSRCQKTLDRLGSREI